ncbi:hypothetical protein [Burkholderia cepacia]|uniref:hypothetical protein n=1 Tax=Burkholderia cepacia TaxID=292 RepID=UPI00075540C0|nr:hypothetical protein [Burkholderia cepacia]KWF99069.1 hypothetical protein WL95_00195 [Burkholderia cepacia]
MNIRALLVAVAHSGARVPDEPESLYGEPTEAQQRLRDMVGCYSEAYLACSYNDATIFHMLLSEDLDAAARAARGRDWAPHWFDGQMDEFIRADGRYQEQLEQAVIAAGCWPDGRTGRFLPLHFLLERYHPMERRGPREETATGPETA